ncbi:hypothetical protein MHB84_13665 [Paenibacillus sp. FSL F4-0087]|uniref:hypothetical protein n=1 Tax=Paenibacillus sp. FSL F4-0087 TaxID=2921368 RepID=UPI0015C3A8CB
MGELIFSLEIGDENEHPHLGKEAASSGILTGDIASFGFKKFLIPTGITLFYID